MGRGPELPYQSISYLDLDRGVDSSDAPADRSRAASSRAAAATAAPHEHWPSEGHDRVGCRCRVDRLSASRSSQPSAAKCWTPSFTDVVWSPWVPPPGSRSPGCSPASAASSVGLRVGRRRRRAPLRVLGARAATVSPTRFPGVPLVGDVRDLDSLPKVDVVTAGFPVHRPVAGRAHGGHQGKAVGPRRRGVPAARAAASRRCCVLENVRNMLVLDGGEAMRYLVDELEALGYRWAYRLVDSRFTGVPQRRQRVIFVASPRRSTRAACCSPTTRASPAADRYDDDVLRLLLDRGPARARLGAGRRPDAQGRLDDRHPVAARRSGRPATSSAGGSSLPRSRTRRRMQGFPRGWTDARRSGQQPQAARAGSSSATP